MTFFFEGNKSLKTCGEFFQKISNPTRSMISFVHSQNRTELSKIDHYDFVILDIIQNFKKNNKNQLIKLSQLEANFWVKVERELAHQNQSAQLGERISKLYLEGFIINKPNLGYTITRKWKELLLSARPVQQ